MFVNAVKNKYMKLKEIVLSLLLLFTVIFQTFSQTNTSQASALEKKEINFNGTSEEISLIETFEDTPLIKNGEPDVNFFLNTNNLIKEDDFSLTYQDFAYLCEKILAKSIKYQLNGKITNVSVLGTPKNAKLTFCYTMDTKEKNFLLKLAGIKDNQIEAVISFDVDIENKKVSNSFEVKKVKISNFVLKTACYFIFGESDYNKLFDKMSNKLFWGIGNLSEFGENELIFKKVQTDA